MAIIFGITTFMRQCRALTNISGNGIAAVVIAWWEGGLDRGKLERALRGGTRERAGSLKSRFSALLVGRR